MLAFQICYFLFQLGHAGFRLNAFLPTVRDAAVVQSLVAGHGQAQLIAHAEQQQTALRTFARALADQFFQQLEKKLFTNWTNRRRARLVLFQ
jgi:hypothetical protein